jgi:hypothetical protein
MIGPGEVGADSSFQLEALQRQREAQKASQSQENQTDVPAPETTTEPSAAAKKTANPLETQTPGQAKQESGSLDLPLAKPESTNPKADAAWGSMGATAQSNSGPKAVPGSENTIDTPEEVKQQDLKKQVAELGIRDALAKNGAPEAELDKLTSEIMEKMFTGKGETPGGNIGFALAEDGGIIHKDASGKEYYEFGIGGEGSSIDLNGDGQNDGSRQYFKVDKAAVDALNGSTTPVMGDDSSSNPQAPVTEATPEKSNLVPSSSDLKDMASAGLKKLQELTGDFPLSDTSFALAQAAADSVLNSALGQLYDLAEPSLESAAQVVQDGVSDLAKAKEQIEELPKQAFDAVKDAPELAKALSPTLSSLTSIAQLTETIFNSNAETKEATAEFSDFVTSLGVEDEKAASQILSLNEGDSITFNSSNQQYADGSAAKVVFYNVADEIYAGLENERALKINPETGSLIDNNQYLLYTEAGDLFATCF